MRIAQVSGPPFDAGRSAEALDPLSLLAVAHGTDKFGEHFYTPHYHRWFARFRQQRVVLLEAGIGGYDDAGAGGESLAMWRDYFPQGIIVGIDIAPKRLSLGPRVEIRQGSMADAAFIAALGAEFAPFDIVIDDGSHVSADTLDFFGEAFPLLRDGGFFAIEDTQTSYWPAFGGSLSAGARTTMNFVKQLMDEVDVAERTLAAGAPSPHPFASSLRAIHRFHNLVMIEKGDNTERSNFAAGRGADPARQAALAAHLALLDAGGGSEGTALACARLMLEAGERSAALARMEAELHRFPDARRLRLLAARTALELRQTDRAAAQLCLVISADALNLDAHVMIAASPALRPLFPDLDELTDVEAARPEADAGAMMKAARVFHSRRRTDRALHWLDRARDCLAGQPPHVALELADAYRRLGAPDAALALYDTVGSTDPLPVEALRRGMLLRAAGRHEAAEEMLTAALALDWRQPRAHLERSRALAALGRDVEAMEAAKAFMGCTRPAPREDAAR